MIHSKIVPVTPQKVFVWVVTKISYSQTDLVLLLTPKSQTVSFTQLQPPVRHVLIKRLSLMTNWAVSLPPLQSPIAMSTPPKHSVLLVSQTTLFLGTLRLATNSPPVLLIIAPFMTNMSAKSVRANSSTIRIWNCTSRPLEPLFQLIWLWWWPMPTRSSEGLMLSAKPPLMIIVLNLNHSTSVRLAVPLTS